MKINDILNEARAKSAVAGGKVQKLITGFGLKLFGQKFDEIDFELKNIDNSSQNVTLKVIYPAEIFGQEVKVPFKLLRRGPFMATDTSKINKGEQEVTEENVAHEPDPQGYQKDLLTMPPYTLVIDTAGDLDWYKLGQHIANLNKQDPHEWGQGDSDMVITLTNQNQVDRLKTILDRFGATYKDIGGSSEHPEVHVKEFKVEKPNPKDTLNIKRKDMPQVASKDYEELFAYLKQNGAHFKKEIVPARSLKAVQAEFSDKGIENQIQKNIDMGIGKKPLIASKDNYIIDGHHRWLAAINTGADLHIIRVDMKVRKLLDLVKKFPKTTYKDIHENINEGYTDTKKGKNLGTYDSRSGAEKREKQVNYFKHIGEATEIEFVCVNPEFCDATDPKNQEALFQALKQVPGIIVYRQDFEVHNSMAAILKSTADRNTVKQIKQLAKKHNVGIDLENNVSNKFIDSLYTDSTPNLIDWYDSDYLNEGYNLQLERDPKMYVLHVTDTKTGKRTEVRGKSDYETTGYDANDKLHQLLDKLGKSANFAELMNGEVVTINPKHPHAAKAQVATDVAFNEETGAEMLKIFRTMHHDTAKNKEMDAFIKAHSWELRDFTPDMFPSEEEFFDYDDPFGRVIDIDYYHRVDLSQPIIVGPQYSDGKYSVIDGNHRAARAQKLGKTIKGYFPVKKVNETAGVGRVVKGVNTTVDVGPNEIINQVKKFGNKVSKDGKPKLNLK